MNLIFPAPEPVTAPIAGLAQRFPVHRIYCVGRNYAEHAREMGAEVDRGQPVFFLKPSDGLRCDDADIPYPPGTRDLHHEVELVVALASGGSQIAVEQALDRVFGYAVGLDLTRRDLQANAKDKRLPWDTGKSFEACAPMGAILPVSGHGHCNSGQIRLEINGELRQRGEIGDMVWSVAEIISELSQLFTLQAGDLIFTGTPSGVAALQRGDRFLAHVDGLPELRGRIC